MMMPMKKTLPYIWGAAGIALITAMAPPAPAQQGDDAPLAVNEEEDAYAIADQLYQQAHAQGLDADSRIIVLNRAATLYADFARRFPRSARYKQALYRQAMCLEEAGDVNASSEILKKILQLKDGGAYAAAAAYKLGALAASRNLWDRAQGYYRIAIEKTDNRDLRYDATYRLGRVLLQKGQRAEAENCFKSVQVSRTAAGARPELIHASLMALAQLKTEDGKDAEALAYYEQLASLQGVDARTRGTATLQAARLASRLGKVREAQEYYSRLSGMAGMEKYVGEAQMESILTLYKNQNYQDVIDQATRNYIQLDDPVKEARRALIVGQSYMELKRYSEASQWFRVAEQAQPRTSLAAEAAYRRLVCIQQSRSGNFFDAAGRYLATYAADSATAQLPINDLVRLMYADRLMQVDTDQAAAQFDSINFNNLPESVRPEAEYKKAWCAAQGTAFDPVPTLDHFISSYPQDSRLPDALALRGTSLLKQNKAGQARVDFDRVINEFPASRVVPVCLQRAAQACSAESNSKDMVKYYEKLIAVAQTARVKPAAIAEAHYSIARALYEKTPAEAVGHFEQARTIDPDRYGAVVSLSLVQCYFKMQDAEKLLSSLEDLKRNYKSSYDGLPAAIPRWCGWMCYQSRNYLKADEYLTDAIARAPREKYTDASGQEKDRPKVEPLVWKTLARTRLELRQFASGLEAAENYVSMEQQPYRKAEGMRDKALLLIGLERYEEARKLCEEAIALGIDGPIKSSIFIALGDAWYAEKQYSEAAKYYGRTANIVSDQELKPLALYKIVKALKHCGKEAEAAQYETSLKTDFPNWQPTGSAAFLIKDDTAQ